MQNLKLQNELLMQQIDALEDHSAEPILTADGPTLPSLSMNQNSMYKQINIHRKMQQLVGSYVKTCTPWGCKVTYKPEDDLNMTWYPGHSGNISWYGKGHKQLDMTTNMFSPLGPVRRQNITRYQTPWHDIVPKASKLGDNWVGFGHSDSFVSVENSGLGVYPQLPPWKLAPLRGFNNYNYSLKPLNFLSEYTPNGSDPSVYGEVNASKLRCPGDPTGKLCLTGSDGVDGVYESSPLSPVFYDPKKVLMEKHGVAVDSWPWIYSPKHHKWGRDAKDHYTTPKDPEFFDYDKAARPFWAYENHAMRSLPAYKDPEGKANKQLMLGQFWNDTKGGFIDDDWVKNASYSLQLEPVHTETWEDDHFANWTHSSPENVKLLYGESGLFSGLRKKRNSTQTEADPWSLGDVPLNASQYADLVGYDDSFARNGDPIRDLQLGWQGQNMVAASSYNLASKRPPREEYSGFAPSAGRTTLEKKGVNVGGPWF